MRQAPTLLVVAGLAASFVAACGGRTPARPPATGDASTTPQPRPAPAARGWPAWACPLGPFSGATEIDPSVPAGTYQAGYRFSREKFITMEHDIREATVGAASITLAEDGSMTGCLGIDQ